MRSLAEFFGAPAPTRKPKRTLASLFDAGRAKPKTPTTQNQMSEPEVDRIVSAKIARVKAKQLSRKRTPAKARAFKQEKPKANRRSYFSEAAVPIAAFTMNPSILGAAPKGFTRAVPDDLPGGMYTLKQIPGGRVEFTPAD